MLTASPSLAVAPPGAVFFVPTMTANSPALRYIKYDVDTATTNELPAATVFEVTAYTAGYESTGKRRGDPLYGIAADGSHVADGIVACSREYPFGTQFYIPELDRTFTCHDRGSAITEGHLDVYMASLRDAKLFGRKRLDVFVVPKIID